MKELTLAIHLLCLPPQLTLITHVEDKTKIVRVSLIIVLIQFGYRNAITFGK